MSDADHQDGEGDEGAGSGRALEAFATDPGSVPDFKAWAKATGNPLVEATQEGGVFHFILKKKEI